MELTNKIKTLTIGEDADHCTTFIEDVYERTLAVFKVEIPPTPARTENYDNRKGLKHLWFPKDQNESLKRPGRTNEHKPAGVQGKDVLVDLQKPSGRDCVGTAKGSGMLNGPLPAGTVRGVPQLRSGRDSPRTEMVPLKGSAPRAHAKPARKTKRYAYNSDRREWMCQETQIKSNLE